MIALIIALVMANAAIAAQPEAPASEFVDGIRAYCTPIVDPGTFIGCEDRQAFPHPIRKRRFATTEMSR